jgi:hypothetical protein
VYGGTEVADIEGVVYGDDLRVGTGAEDSFKYGAQKTGEREGEGGEDVSGYTCSKGVVAWM